jgi:hypothetical protein
MNRRDFLKSLGIGVVALSTTTYFDMGRGLWSQEPEISIPTIEEVLRLTAKHRSTDPQDIIASNNATMLLIKQHNNKLLRSEHMYKKNNYEYRDKRSTRKNTINSCTY